MNEARAGWNAKVKIFHEKRNSLKQEKSAKTVGKESGTILHRKSHADYFCQYTGSQRPCFYINCKFKRGEGGGAEKGAGLVKFTSVGRGLKPGDLLTSNLSGQNSCEYIFHFRNKRKSNGQAMPNNLGLAGSLKIEEIFHSNKSPTPPLSPLLSSH